MSMRGAVALGISLILLATAAGPAAASTGGAAAATGVHAAAGEVRLTVTTEGAIGGLQPVIGSLTAEPLLDGQQLTLAEAATPPEPSGTEGGSAGTASVGQVLSLEGVTARTDRVEDGNLSATAGIDGAAVRLFGLDVLDVGEVRTEAITHPDREPTATAHVEHLEVFGTPVTVRAGEPLERSLELSTDQVLDALADLVPGLSAVTGFAARVAGAGGRVDVRLSSDEHADEATGTASAVGLNALVHLSLDLRLCLPELRGDGCVGEVRIQTDARVLDTQLGHSRVQRPDALERPLGGHAVPLAVLASLLAAVVVYVGYRRRGALRRA